MRILLVGSINSRHVEHLAIALRQRGHDVRVTGDYALHLPRPDLSSYGVVVTELAPRPSAIPGLKAARRVQQLRAVVREFRPDVVHAHFVWWWGFFALAAGAGPLVVSAWGSDILGADRKARLLNRIVLRRANLVLSQCRDVLRRTQALGAHPDRTHIVSWGVDLRRFTPSSEPRDAIRQRLGLDPGPLVLSPRELTPLYNPEVIAAAFTRVLAAVPDAQLVFKHQREGPPEASPLAGHSRVRIIGGGDYTEMADYYRAADVCLSIPSTDNSPRSVWEAMACGCPCVVSDIPWVEDRIEPGKHAVVVPIDAELVADAVTRLLLDRSFSATVGEAGRLLSVKHEDRERQLDRLIQLYRNVLPTANSGTASTS
jgi:L-malate glycosyltransferase